MWLPHAAVVHLIELRADGTVTAPEPGTTRRWVHYGSSISHCLEATRPTGVWPVVAARRAAVDLQSFAFAGQCQLDPFAARMIATQPADLVSLKLGINIVNADSMRERTFVPSVHGFLDTIRDRHPEVPLVLITPITCPVVEDHPGPTGVDEPAGAPSSSDPRSSPSVRSPCAASASSKPRSSPPAGRPATPTCTSSHGPELFGPDDVEDLPDGLHPNHAGYQRIGERFHALAFEGDGPFRT